MGRGGVPRNAPGDNFDVVHIACHIESCTCALHVGDGKGEGGGIPRTTQKGGDTNDYFSNCMHLCKYLTPCWRGGAKTLFQGMPFTGQECKNLLRSTEQLQWNIATSTGNKDTEHHQFISLINSTFNKIKRP